MTEARALARPQKSFPVSKKMEIVTGSGSEPVACQVDPVFVLFGVHGRCVGKLTHRRFFLTFALVEWQQCELRRVRRPPIAGPQTHFFRIAPVQLAIAHFLGPAMRKLAWLSARRAHHP